MIVVAEAINAALDNISNDKALKEISAEVEEFACDFRCLPGSRLIYRKEKGQPKGCSFFGSAVLYRFMEDGSNGEYFVLAGQIGVCLLLLSEVKWI